MNEKKCIYHYTHPIEENAIGSGVRPYMMLNAFKSIGYDVEEISGYGKERKKKIKELINKIKNGERYDFLYSESLTEPTLLSEKKHFPLHPLIDLKLFKCCKRNAIPIGLFYRDIHWKYDLYKKTVPLYKRCITIPLYRLDLIIYNKFLNVLFCPTKEFSDIINVNIDKIVLPPGCVPNKDVIEQKKLKKNNDKKLSIFYVGSIVGRYDIRKLIEAVKLCKDVFLIICTPEEQWVEKSGEFADIICDRVSVIHKRSRELGRYYQDSDVSINCTESEPYYNIASPIKCKETIGYGTPIIVSSNLCVADEIVTNGYGWKVKNDVSDLVNLFSYLRDNPEEIMKKTKKTIDAIPLNSWEKRAELAASSLLKHKK